VDLPTPQERATILAIHLTRHHRDYGDFDLARHAEATDGFSGAELEQVVVSSLYDAFAEGENAKLEDRHVEGAISATRPLSQSMGSKIARLREEARLKWRQASGAGAAGELTGEVGMSEPPPAPKKPKRVFEV
jgi:SpoVK/Ycf46/Vps4 family AAA+-type ATPase